MKERNENGGNVCHRHHSGETKRVVVKSESRRFLIFRPSSEWPNAKRGPFPRKGYETKSYPIRGNGPLFAFGQFRCVKSVVVKVIGIGEGRRGNHSYLADNRNRTGKWD